MGDKTLIEVNRADKDKFKIIAAKEKKTMEKLFHEWVDRDGRGEV
jgi:hypothetical protein